MRLYSIIASKILLLALSGAATGQPLSQRSPLDQAKNYASIVKASVSICPIAITNLGLALRLKQLDPKNPLGKTPTEVATELDNCAKNELASLPTLKAAQVDKNASALSEKCKSALDELHISAMVHYENFAADPSELLPVMERRINSESSQLRNQASRAILLCGS